MTVAGRAALEEATQLAIWRIEVLNIQRRRARLLAYGRKVASWHRRNRSRAGR